MNAELYRQAGLAVYYDVTWDDGSPRWKGKDWASDDLAVELLSHAIELDPANPALYRDRGRLCDEEGYNHERRRQAFDDYVTAYILDPDSAEIWAELASITLGLPPAARIVLLERAVQAAAEGSTFPLWNLAMAYHEAGIPEKEEEVLTQYLKRLPEGDTMIRHAKNYLAGLSTKRYVCPVCGYPWLDGPARNEAGEPSHEICASCGFEFGKTDDIAGHSYEKWRDLWIKDRYPQRRWIPGPFWDSKSQLSNIGMVVDSPQEFDLRARLDPRAGWPTRRSARSVGSLIRALARVLRRWRPERGAKVAAYRYGCPVCGYQEMDQPAVTGYGFTQSARCDCCMFQFGVTDESLGWTYGAWRNYWFQEGMPWRGIAKPPADWDPIGQLRMIGVEARPDLD